MNELMIKYSISFSNSMALYNTFSEYFEKFQKSVQICTNPDLAGHKKKSIRRPKYLNCPAKIRTYGHPNHNIEIDF